MNKTDFLSSIVRWTHASIKDTIKSKWSGCVLQCEGEEDRNPSEPSFAELRIEGPTLTREGTLGEYQGVVAVSILLTVQRDAKYVHVMQDKIGICLAVFDTCIPVKRIGKVDPVLDTGAVIGFLQLVPEYPMRVSNFGQIDKSTLTQQATVEAHYRFKMEI